MAIVSERMNANKPPPPASDPKNGKLAPGTLNNGRDLEADLKKEDGFFGSFWPGGKKPPANKKVGASAMDTVCSLPSFSYNFLCVAYSCLLCCCSLLLCCVHLELFQNVRRWRRKLSNFLSLHTSVFLNVPLLTWYQKVYTSLLDALKQYCLYFLHFFYSYHA